MRSVASLTGSLSRRLAGASLCALAALLPGAARAQAPKAPAPSWYAPAVNWLKNEPVPVQHAIQAPHYGDSLFYFYQSRYFTSVTNLMVSQQLQRVLPHDDEAEVLRGGLYLSYGLHKEAGEVFAQLIERGARQPVRDRAWYFLAKIRYQRGFAAQAEEALARIEQPLPGELEEDRVLLHANLLMARNDFVAATKLLEGAEKQTRGRQYARYNLGVALIRSGQAERGAKLLDELGRAPAADEELRALRDRANVALGYSALQSQAPMDARRYLERVRLSSMLANKALLGFGWAAAELKDHRKALVPWTELASRDGGDAAVLEARIAVPYAFAELGAYGQALAHYEDALAAFDTEQNNLDQSIGAIRQGHLLDGLMTANPGEEMGWFWKIDRLPDMPHAGHLTQVLAQHNFQEGFKNYRDLHFLAQNLGEWQAKLAVFDDMLAARRAAYANRLPQVELQQRALDIEVLAVRREKAAAELAQAEVTADGAAFADAKDRELAARLERVRATLAQAAQDGRDDPDLAAARDRYRRVAGAMQWRLTQELSVRLWEAQKAMRELDTALAEARRRDAALARAQRDEPARFDALAARITVLAKRLDALSPRVAELTGVQKQYVEALAIAELDQQKERLVAYTTQARFAVAQLYDRASLAQGGPRAP
jgi:hypothetical protein